MRFFSPIYFYSTSHLVILSYPYIVKYWNNVEQKLFFHFIFIDHYEVDSTAMW